MVRWCEDGVLLPMTISVEEFIKLKKEKSNLFCACHLLNCKKRSLTTWSHRVFGPNVTSLVAIARARNIRYCMCITLLCVYVMYGAYIPFPYCTLPSCKICKLIIYKLVDSYNVSDAASTSVNKQINKIKNQQLHLLDVGGLHDAHRTRILRVIFA
jgi:hypothetical protein